MLRLTTQQLADLAGFDKTTIIRMESYDRETIRSHNQNVKKVVDVLKTKGVQFVSGENGDGVLFKAP